MEKPAIGKTRSVRQPRRTIAEWAIGSLVESEENDVEDEVDKLRLYLHRRKVIIPPKIDTCLEYLPKLVAFIQNIEEQETSMDDPCLSKRQKSVKDDSKNKRENTNYESKITKKDFLDDEFLQKSYGTYENYILILFLLNLIKTEGNKYRQLKDLASLGLYDYMLQVKILTVEEEKERLTELEKQKGELKKCEIYKSSFQVHLGHLEGRGFIERTGNRKRLRLNLAKLLEVRLITAKEKTRLEDE